MNDSEILKKIRDEWKKIKNEYENGIMGTEEDEFNLLISYLDRMDAIIRVVPKRRYYE